MGRWSGGRRALPSPPREDCTLAEPLILLVDDHPLFCQGFAAMLRALRPGWRLRLAESAAAALAAVAEEQPDLVVLDAMLADDDGFALGARLAAGGVAAPRLVVSSRDDAVMRTRALSSGALGLVGKAASADAIVAALETALAGRSLFDGTPPAAVPELTPRQAQVLNLLAAGYGNKQICFELSIAERTVRAHLTELFQLLGAHSRTQALIRARDLGLIAAR